jgi:23S rRNA (adenine1618-N6)-methyltransferase
MPEIEKQKPAEKENLHPRNLHRGQYNFKQLCKVTPALSAFVAVNEYGTETIDFSNPQAVKLLNRALLNHFYKVNGWDIPEGYLCPPIPGRADYIHYMADLLAESNAGKIPKGNTVKVLDIGIGANCVYPVIGHSVYGWQFVGADIDSIAVISAKEILANNPKLQGVIDIRQQPNPNNIFKGIIKPGEFFDLTICNPPFHKSLKEALAGTMKKWDNLGVTKPAKATSNFGGQGAELWCPGGEANFISRMIEQSADAAKSCFWFSTLVSKKESLSGIYSKLNYHKAVEVKTINMAQGQKVSRAVAWTFLNAAEQLEWAKRRQAVK